MFAVDQNATGDIPVTFFSIDHADSVVLTEEHELVFQTQDSDKDPRDADLGGLVGIAAAESAEDVFTPMVERSRERPILAGDVRCSPCIELLATCQTHSRELRFKGASWFTHNRVPFFDGTRERENRSRNFCRAFAETR